MDSVPSIVCAYLGPPGECSECGGHDPTGTGFCSHDCAATRADREARHTADAQVRRARENLFAAEVDRLPLAQYLVLDVLAARYRTGEHLWTFPSSARPAVRALAQLGLVEEMHGITPKTIRASLTEAGEAAVLKPGWLNPADEARRLLVDWIRRASDHIDGQHLFWPTGLGPEPSWFAGAAILADPVLRERYGLTEQETMP